MAKHTNRKIFRLYRGTLIGAVALYSMNLWALPTFAPSWAQQGFHKISPNDSLLMDIETRTSTKTTIEDEIFDPKQVREAQVQYQSMVSKYELRKSYGLVNMQEEQAHTDQLSSWGMGIFTKARMKKLRSTLKDVETNVSKDPNGRYFSKPIAVAGFVAAACTGVPVEFTLGMKTNVTSVTNVTDQTGRVVVENPILNAGVYVAGKVPSKPTDTITKGERYKFSLSRKLPFGDFTSGVSYGTTTGGVTASLAKNIVENLTCVLDSTRPATAGSTLTRQETLKLLYRLRF